MNRDNKRIASEKPVVIARKKAGKASTPTGPAKTVPRVSLPATQTTAPATHAQPPVQLPPPLAQPEQPEVAPQPQSTAEAALSKSAERKQRRSEILDILRTRWPQTFPRDFRQVRPWAIGIAKDVARLLPDYPAMSVKDAISIYRLLATAPYCRALLQGGPRYGLDGTPRGEVTAEDQERAQRDLQAWYERRREKQKRRAVEKAGDSPQM
jgi:ProP effector